MKQYIFWGAAAIAVLLLASNAASAETTQDHYKDVYYKTPHQVEVCYDQQVSGDKTGDTLKGAILGGVIGNNVGDIKNGGALGAVIGGMIGHNNSKATGGTQTGRKQTTTFGTREQQQYQHHGGFQTTWGLRACLPSGSDAHNNDLLLGHPE